MPLAVAHANPTLLIRAEAYERAGLSRARIDDLLTLTDEEFRVERGLIAVGPIFDTAALEALIDALEQLGLEYYEDFFELSGVWPEWLRLFAAAD
jgi:hypothetical protein